MDIVDRLRAMSDSNLAVDAAAEIERLRDLLRDVRAEIDLRKSPKLLERIEAALTAAKGSPA